MNDDRLLELLLRWEEDGLTPEEERELEERLEKSPQARRELVDQFMLGAECRRLSRAVAQPSVRRPWRIAGWAAALAAAVLVAAILLTFPSERPPAGI